MRPNAITQETKLEFLSDVEGQVRVLVCGDDPEKIKPLVKTDTGKVLTAPAAYATISSVFSPVGSAFSAFAVESYAVPDASPRWKTAVKSFQTEVPGFSET